MQGSDFVEAWVFVGLEGADNGVNCVWGDVIMIGEVLELRISLTARSTGSSNGEFDAWASVCTLKKVSASRSALLPSLYTRLIFWFSSGGMWVFSLDRILY